MHFILVSALYDNNNFAIIKLFLNQGSTISQESLDLFIAGQCNKDSIKILKLFINSDINLDYYSKSNNATFLQLIQEDDFFGAITVAINSKAPI